MKGESMKTQILVIGAGPGGYTAAFRAADLGLKVMLVDAQKDPGGVCLFRGCIPTKALLHAAKLITQCKESADIGITCNDIRIEPSKINAFKDGVVNKLAGGLSQLAKARHIDFIQGRAQFLDSHTVSITGMDGQETTASFDHAVLAPGSAPVQLPFAPWSRQIMPSGPALNVDSVPQSLLIIGGGYIGLEFATFYSALGTQVTIAEMMPDILPGADRDVVAVLKKRLSTRLAAIHTRTKVSSIERKQDSCAVTFEDQESKKSNAEFEKVLVAVGRVPFTQDLGLEKTKIKCDEAGFVKVNPQRRTTDRAIYAVGDITGQPLLAHKASHEGLVAAANIAGKEKAFDSAAIPAVVFTDPEVAWCGLTETAAKEKNIPVKICKFPWMASGRAMTLNRTDGLTKIVADPQSGRVLGMTIVGESAGEMISEGVLAIGQKATVEDIMSTIHPHPTLSETIPEAAEAFHNLSLHIYRSRT